MCKWRCGRVRCTRVCGHARRIRVHSCSHHRFRVFLCFHRRGARLLAMDNLAPRPAPASLPHLLLRARLSSCRTNPCARHLPRCALHTTCPSSQVHAQLQPCVVHVGRVAKFHRLDGAIRHQPVSCHVRGWGYVSGSGCRVVHWQHSSCCLLAECVTHLRLAFRDLSRLEHACAFESLASTSPTRTPSPTALSAGLGRRRCSTRCLRSWGLTILRSARGSMAQHF